MKDILQDIVAKTHALGFLNLVKVTGTDESTTIESMAEDRSVILTAITKDKVNEFGANIFGMPNLDKLALHLKAKVICIVSNKKKAALLKELGVEYRLINLKGMTQGMLVILGQKNIKKLSDFADLSSDELIGGFDEFKGKKIRIEGYLEEFSLSRKEADDLIMAAREIVYK